MKAQTAAGDIAVDIVIRGGTVYDGTGGEPRLVDVGIQGERIVAVGNLRGARAGLVVAKDGSVAGEVGIGGEDGPGARAGYPTDEDVAMWRLVSPQICAALTALQIPFPDVPSPHGLG